MCTNSDALQFRILLLFVIYFGSRDSRSLSHIYFLFFALHRRQHLSVGVGQIGINGRKERIQAVGPNWFVSYSVEMLLLAFVVEWLIEMPSDRNLAWAISWGFWAFWRVKQKPFFCLNEDSWLLNYPPLFNIICSVIQFWLFAGEVAIDFVSFFPPFFSLFPLLFRF